MAVNLKFSCLFLPVFYMSYVESFSSGPSETLCPPVPGKPGCVCSHPDGIIDLTPLSYTNGTARFTEVTDTNDYTYQFNPCNTFSVDGLCSDVFICQGTTWDEKVGYEIAMAGTEQIKIDANGTAYLSYTGPDDRMTRVYLICDRMEDGKTVTTTDGDSKELFHYVFNLTSPYACPNTSLKSQSNVAGVTGFALILLLLAVLLTYLITGSLVRKCKHKSTGSDLIPNKSFWIGFPLLVKDGVMFTFRPCVRLLHYSARSRQGYKETLNESLI